MSYYFSKTAEIPFEEAITGTSVKKSNLGDVANQIRAKLKRVIANL